MVWILETLKYKGAIARGSHFGEFTYWYNLQLLNMKRLFVLVVLFVFSQSLFAQKQIIGKWLSEDGEGITEIYEQRGKYFGKIQWLKKPNDDKGRPFTDTENPDKSKRNQPLLGLVILKDFVYNNNEWQNGTIYDPNNGITYSCTIWISNGELKVRGYWGIFYQTQTWTKTK
jgi:uncharacterized protein (DUF2147 family)